MVKSDYKELSELIDYLRANGVVQYKANGVELTILPDAPVKPEKEPKRKEKDEEVAKKKGADGRTAEEQRELYGRVLDAEE